MAKRSLELAQLLFDKEPDALRGDPAAVDRATNALVKIIGVYLAAILARDGEEALEEAVRRVAKTVELEARETATTMPLLKGDTGGVPDIVN